MTVVAHSHGGNVALDGVRRSGVDPDQVSVVTIGTPFLSLVDGETRAGGLEYRGRLVVPLIGAIAAGIWLVRPSLSGVVVGWVLPIAVMLLIFLAITAVDPRDDLETLRNEPASGAPVTVVSVPRDEAALVLRLGRLVDAAGRLVEQIGWFPLVLLGLGAGGIVGLSFFEGLDDFAQIHNRPPSSGEDLRWIRDQAAAFINEEYSALGLMLLVSGVAIVVGLAAAGAAYWSCGFDGLSFLPHGRFLVTETPSWSANVHHVVKPPAAGGLKHTALTSDPAVIDLVVDHLRSAPSPRGTT